MTQHHELAGSNLGSKAATRLHHVQAQRQMATLIADEKCGACHDKKKLFLLLTNAAGYDPGLCTPSATDGEKGKIPVLMMTHIYEVNLLSCFEATKQVATEPRHGSIFTQIKDIIIQ